MNQPSVAAVVLNWESYEDTLSTVKSLKSQEYSNLQIVVVDNGSEDGSGDRLASALDESVIQLGQNLGFSEGMNHGVKFLEQNDPEYIWLLNNDIKFGQEDILSNLVAAAERNPPVCVVSPLISTTDREYTSGNNEEYWFERGEVNLEIGSIGHTSLPEVHERLVDSGYVPFTAALIDFETYSDLGGLSDEYFLYYEDVDFCTRAAKVGRVVVDTDTVVGHDVSNSSDGEGASPTKAYYRLRNHFIYMRKFGKKCPFYQRGFCIQSSKEFGEHLLNGEIGCVKAMVRGLVDGLRGDTGKGPYP